MCYSCSDYFTEVRMNNFLRTKSHYLSKRLDSTELNSTESCKVSLTCIGSTTQLNCDLVAVNNKKK